MGRKIKHNYKEILEEYSGENTLIKLAKKHNIPYMTLYDNFKKLKLKLVKKLDRRREGYYVDDKYLNKIDTEKKAYFLGMMLADGCVINNAIAIKLKNSDEYLIEEMFQDFSSGYKLSKDKNSSSISITSELLKDDLALHGCVNNKTLVGFKVPNIDKNLFGDFLRGYFDGDGSISKRKYRKHQRQVSICSIDESFLIDLQKILENFGINTKIFKETRNGKPLKTPEGKILFNCKDMYRITFLTHIDRMKLFELMYKNCTIKLERKYVLFEEYYANTVLTLETNKSRAVQRIGDEPLIDYDLLKETFNFHTWREYNSPKSVRQPGCELVENIC